MPDLEFDITSHRYSLDGVQIPACTHVLAAMGATPGFQWLSPDELEFYRSRGHAVHSAVEYAIKGVLDRRTVAQEVKGYLIGWERAVNDLGIEVVTYQGEPFVEVHLCSRVFGYGVTPDVVARTAITRDTGVIEIKATSVHAPATGIQLAAQLRAVREVMPEIGQTRIGLRLLQQEPYYDFKLYQERGDDATWVGLLNSYKWLKAHKLLKENLR